MVEMGGLEPPTPYMRSIKQGLSPDRKQARNDEKSLIIPGFFFDLAFSPAFAGFRPFSLR